MPYEQRPVPVCGCGNREPHVHLVVPIVVASAALFVLLLVGSFLAASRSSSDGSPRQATTGTPHGTSQPLPRATAALDAADAGAGVEDRSPAGGVPPAQAVRFTGTATWYCSATSACTRGYRPSDLVAAIDRKDTTFRKGDRVVVRFGSKHVTVRIVDTCACADRRVIDLTSGAFRRLAPLAYGVLPVTVELAEPGVTPPQTDEETP